MNRLLVFLLGMLAGMWFGLIVLAMQLKPCADVIEDGKRHVCYRGPE